MNWIKNFLFVSYLKNKGVRRLCFIIGLFFCIIAISIWLDYAKYNFYNISFASLEEVVKKRPNEEVLRHIFNKYPVNFGKHLDNFDRWKRFFFESWTEDYKLKEHYLDVCNRVKDIRKLDIGKIRENYPMYNDLSDNELYQRINEKNKICEQLKKYIKQKIILNKSNYLFLLTFLYVIMIFYFPFFLCCMLKWIKDGFKESRKVN